MSGQFWKLALCAAVLAVYAALGLSSRRFEPDPPWMKNGVVPTSEGGLVFLAPGSARAAQPPQWLPAVIRQSSIEIALDVRTYQEEQYGPARILTVSRDKGHRNLTIGQQGDRLVVRLRTVATSENGLPAYEIPGVFGDGELHSITVSVEGTKFRVIVDGEVTRQDSLPADPLRNWDPGYSLLLGNEEGGQRQWVGEIRRATVRAGGETFEYADAESLIIPEYFQVRGYAASSGRSALRGGKLPRGDIERVAIHDMAKNLYGFIPLGLLLVILWRRHTFTTVLIYCGLLSLLIETIQFVVPGRYPHLADFCLNILGGMLGALLGRTMLAAVRARRRWSG